MDHISLELLTLGLSIDLLKSSIDLLGTNVDFIALNKIKFINLSICMCSVCAINDLKYIVGYI